MTDYFIVAPNRAIFTDEGTINSGPYESYEQAEEEIKRHSGGAPLMVAKKAYPENRHGAPINSPRFILDSDFNDDTPDD